MPILPAKTLEDTRLFRRLQQLEIEKSCAPGLSGNVLALCSEAAERLKIFPAIHGQFTLHDETHTLRVVQLMQTVVGSIIERLNGIELALLIMAAYFHDQGMVVDATELEEIRSSDDWKLHEQNWIADHPNFEETLAKLNDALLTESERQRVEACIAELRAAMFTDFIRKTHGERSARFLTQRYGRDPRLVVNSRPVVDLLAQICVSHVRRPEAITQANGFHLDELVGTTKVNMALLAYVLRLADILDFDRERTPDSLYRAIHFTSKISLIEWQKHRSVIGWEVASDRILFAAECEHPAYERAIREFLGWIDSELAALESWGRSLPAEAQEKRLQLPQQVDRSRIGPHFDPVTREPAYRYYDLEFSLSRDAIVKLLMTDRLYSNKSLFIRELLQNAVDALRHRRALYQASGVSLSDLKVDFKHYQESGFDIVRCQDNGMGMDEQIITKFLTRAGRSYYRSPEFERERARFKASGCDFDPCARFGIGFMSCFMFGDEIVIRTRRDYGMGHDHGQPLIVEIKGLSGIVVIRMGRADQVVGTTIEIRGRRKSFTLDRWSDPVDLIEVLNGYALAVEFPITAECSVPAIAEQIRILPLTDARPHELETIDVRAKRVVTSDFASVDQRLGGQIRVCTLTDEAGIPAIANAEARVELNIKSSPQSSEKLLVLAAGGKSVNIRHGHVDNQLCCDGILVAGRPGRAKELLRLGHCSVNLGFGSAAFLLDARGELKPALTPARTPPDVSFREDPSWVHLFKVASRAYSTLLAQMVEECAKSSDPDRFWLVAEAYSFDIYHLPLVSVWRHLRIPIATAEGEVEWARVAELGRPRFVMPTVENESMRLVLPSGKILGIPSSIRGLQGDQHGWVSVPFLQYMLTAMSTLDVVSATELELTLREPENGECLADRVIREMPSWHWFFRFGGNLANAICISGDLRFANAEHPVVQAARRLHYKPWDEQSPLERLIGSLAFGAAGRSFAEEMPEKSWAARNRKQLAMLYRAVDWKSVEAPLRPPYNMFTPGRGIETLTKELLEKWEKLPFVATDF